MNKGLRIFLGCVAFSLIVGVITGLTIKEFYGTHESETHDLSINSVSDNLQEEMWFVDLIVEGTVISRGETVKQNAGIETKKGSFSFDVTPSTIKVDKVLYGDISSTELTFFQHGSLEDSTITNRFVQKEERVILLLDKRPDGKGYWSYNFEDGLWRVKEGKVYSKTDKDILKTLSNTSVDVFKSTISEAAKNKKRNPNYQ